MARKSSLESSPKARAIAAASARQSRGRKNGRGAGSGQVKTLLPLQKSARDRRIERIQRWMEANLPPPGTPEWEALCTGCGECCYDKVWRGDQLLRLKSACGFLDAGTNRCQVYAERFEREPLCMPIGPEIIEMGGLPEDCPYVAALPGYRGPIPVDKTLDEC